jgi:glycosyltransferase involved in cell wall biosynthesis
VRLSVVIPTLNEAGYLAAAVERVREGAVLAGPHEVIVSDCGSTDDTRERALALGALLVSGPPVSTSRASALNAGASRASGDVLLFLDADTLLPRGYDGDISRVLGDPGVVGGAFEFALRGRGAGLRLVEVLNRIRYRVRPRYFGDQGIFVRADVFKSMDGYADRRIMEASEFCGRLGRRGRLALIRKPALTSARRFQEGGVYRVLGRDIIIWLLDLAGFSVEGFAEAYRENNLRRGHGPFRESSP